jgi:RNA polymerase sigma-70 factor (ECF subfamily)
MMGNSPPPDRLVQWFLQWREPICRFLGARRAVNKANIDDIAQEVFLRMVRYDHSASVSNPQSYLFKMAANVAAEWSMRPRERRPHASEWLADLVVDSSPESEFLDQAAQAELLAAINALPARPREILRLHFVESLTREQIAARMSLSARVVKRELIRAYATLRHSLGEQKYEMETSQVG